MMLEPENQQTSYQPSLLDESTELNAFNRSDLRVAGGWAIFLGILSVISMAFALYGIINVSNTYLRYGFGFFSGIELIPTILALVINAFMIYWYLTFGNASRRAAAPNAQARDMQQMSAGVLAIFRFWGIFILIIILFYIVAFAFAITS